MVSLIERIEELIAPTIESLGFLVVRILFLSSKRPTLQIMIETIDGSEVTVKNCAEVSRSVARVLDAEDPIDEEYVLEISSPGTDRPIVKLKDFDRFAGFKAKVHIASSIERKNKFIGILRGVKKGNILMEINDKNCILLLPFSDLVAANLIATDEMFVPLGGHVNHE